MKTDTIGRPMEILMIEDSLTFARITMGALRNGGIEHRLTWLSDGAEAMDFLHRRDKYSQAPRPDLILLDLGLPSVDGRVVLREIRREDRLAGIPVVVMTASTDEEDRLHSERLQVEAFMIKPINLKKFLDLVRRLKRYWHADMLLPNGI